MPTVREKLTEKNNYFILATKSKTGYKNKQIVSLLIGQKLAKFLKF